MSQVRFAIKGSKVFITKVVNNWREVKPYLETLEKLGEVKEIKIEENELIKVRAYLTREGSIIINCDEFTVRNVVPLINLLKAHHQIVREYGDLISIFVTACINQLEKLNREYRGIIESLDGGFKAFTEHFILALIHSLELTLSLEKLSKEERKSLEQVEGIKTPLRSSIENFIDGDLRLYMIIVLSNLWRRALGCRPENLAPNVNIDLNGLGELEELFDEILDDLRARDSLSLIKKARTVVEFALRTFGINLERKRTLNSSDEDKNMHMFI